MDISYFTEKKNIAVHISFWGSITKHITGCLKPHLGGRITWENIDRVKKIEDLTDEVVTCQL